MDEDLFKEVANELASSGVDWRYEEDAIHIAPGLPHGAVIDSWGTWAEWSSIWSYDDRRDLYFFRDDAYLEEKRGEYEERAENARVLLREAQGHLAAIEYVQKKRLRGKSKSE